MSNLEDRKRARKSKSSSTTSSTDRQPSKKPKPGTPEDEPRSEARDYLTTVSDDNDSGGTQTHHGDHIADADAAETGAREEEDHEVDSLERRKVKIKLLVEAEVEGEEEEEEEEEQQQQQPKQPSFYETFPGMPAPDLATAYQIPSHIQSRLAIMDPGLAARQRAKDDAHTLSSRRSLWETAIAAAEEQGMTKEQREGEYLEDTDLTAAELHRVVLREAEERAKGKQRQPSYHIESDEEGVLSD